MDQQLPLSSVTVEHVRAALEHQRLSVADELRHYPTPIAGCDQHFNGLLEQHHRLRRQIQHLDALCAEAQNADDLARRLGDLILAHVPDEAYPHDTVHSHEVAHG